MYQDEELSLANAWVVSDTTLKMEKCRGLCMGWAGQGQRQAGVGVGLGAGVGKGKTN